MRATAECAVADGTLISLERPSPVEPQPTVEIAPSSGWFNFDLRETWAARELLLFLIWRDLKVRYKQTVIGVVWVIIQPLLTMLIFSFFFGRLAKIPSGGLPYPLFYYCALLPWTYFATALSGSTQVMIEHERVITKVYFPRVLLPLSAVLSGLVDFAVSLVILVGMIAYYNMPLRPSMLLLPLFLALAVATAFGMGLWLSALNAIYRDVRHAIPFLIQLWMFASPVAYPSSLVPGKWRWLYSLNPMAGVIEGFRWAATGHGRPPGPQLLISAGMVCVLLLTGFMYFKSMEGTIADRI